MCQLALAACLLALFSQIKIDLPGYVPLTLQTFMVYVIALTCSKHINRYGACFLGTFVCYAIGTGYFMLVSQMALMPSLMMCVIPFLPGDFVKIILAKKVAEKIKIRTENYA